MGKNIEELYKQNEEEMYCDFCHRRIRETDSLVHLHYIFKDSGKKLMNIAIKE